MRACIQRVSEAKVTIEGQVVGQIDRGLLVLLGVAQGDTSEDAKWLVEKIVELRIFDDGAGKMNHSLADIGGELLIVSQFTLLGDCNKGRRPSFSRAAPPDEAERLYEEFVSEARSRCSSVKTGRFRAAMSIGLVNDGPVTLIIESRGP